MIVGQEKPSLDDDLLLHFGIRGMKWGLRRKRDPAPGEKRNGMSKSTKIAIGVSVAAGVAAAAYIVATRGQSPATRAFSSKANGAGRRMSMGIIKKMGSVTVKTLRTTANVGSKAVVKTTTTTARLTTKATTTVGRNTGRTFSRKTTETGRKIALAYKRMSAKRALRNAGKEIESGSRMVNLVVGRFGTVRLNK